MKSTNAQGPQQEWKRFQDDTELCICDRAACCSLLFDGAINILFLPRQILVATGFWQGGLLMSETIM
jgi:hypothetical protein